MEANFYSECKKDVKGSRMGAISPFANETLS